MESLWGKLTYLRLSCFLTLVAGGITVNTHLALERVGDLGTNRTNRCETQLSPYTGGGGGGASQLILSLPWEKQWNLRTQDLEPKSQLSSWLWLPQDVCFISMNLSFWIFQLDHMLYLRKGLCRDKNWFVLDRPWLRSSSFNDTRNSKRWGWWGWLEMAGGIYANFVGQRRA